MTDHSLSAGPVWQARSLAQPVVGWLRSPYHLIRIVTVAMLFAPVGTLARTVELPILNLQLTGNVKGAPAGLRDSAGLRLETRVVATRDCTESMTVTHTDANFSGGSLQVQAGFAENEIAAVSYELSPGDFPIKIEKMECVFAQLGAIEPTVTEWSVLIWDGLPNDGSLVGQFSSDDIILPHLRLAPGTQGANILVTIDPDDPEQIFILNDSGTNMFTIGFRVDRHNHQTENPCLVAPPSNRNAFPTTDLSGLSSADGNWLLALNCPAGCPSGWHPFSQLGLCRPSGDWIIRATYSRAVTNCEGACCDGDGGCLDGVDGDACALGGGQFMGPDSLCASVTCPGPVGACCLGVTCLTDVTVSQCAVVSGIYLGTATSCDGDPCESGACCMEDGGCADLINLACDTAGGTFQGIDTDCASFDCPQPTGSCCINSTCIPGQTQEVCEAVGVFNGVDSTCDPDPCVPDECPEGTIVEAWPPTGTIDARQPHPVDDDSLAARQGIGGPDEPIIITLNTGGASPGCFTICETAVDPQLGPNTIIRVTALPSMQTYEIELARPITTGAVTTVSYDHGDFIVYTSHPGNVDGDSGTFSFDILKVIDYVNQVDAPPHGLYGGDIDHSGMINSIDILRTIDLLNGADLYQAWNNTQLPVNTTCP